MTITRSIEPKVTELAKKFPVISITGPRQSGKTTLARKVFSDFEYFNLEDPNTRDLISRDPKQFINPSRTHIIFDEVQKVPELLSYIQVTVDEVKKQGLYVISGSENLLLSEKVSQSLAGRVAIFNLLPFSIEELTNANQLVYKNAFKQILKGFYPRIYDHNIASGDFYSNYLATYIDRDVRQIKNIGNITQFHRFLQLVAGRVGQLFNVSAIANDVGVDSKTITSWLSILEASFITFRLTPYFNNFGKRLVKSPKVYFYDVGLLSYLLGIDTQTEMDTHFARGGLFENLVIADLVKHITHHKLNVKPYFWRDSNGNELDLILDHGSRFDAVEIKASSLYKEDFTKGLDYWEHVPAPTPIQKLVIYTGELENTVKDHRLVNWKHGFTIADS